ncbi:MAG: acetyl-CoA carboxylase carboxyltransferase subunit alpha [Elusimicrobiota bacterium]
MVEISDKIDKCVASGAAPDKIKELVNKKKLLTKKIFSGMTPWQKVQLARHPMRPYTDDYIKGIFDDFIEFHGDRKFADDHAIIGGLASLRNSTIMVVGNQKGRTIEESQKRNYGMSHPEGYRKGLRLMKLAEKFGFPVVTFVDTPGAYCGIEAEERGQAEAIATNLKEMAGLRVPVVVVIIGEGGSGGALGIAVGDRILMLENAVYFVCTPEACSAILWRDSSKAEQAAETMRLTPKDLMKLGIIDEIIKEPLGGAHWNYENMFDILKERIVYHLGVLKRTKPENLVNSRYQKFRHMGVYNK